MSAARSDDIPSRRASIGAPAEAQMTAAERAARIDALMALPIKQRPRITVVGDDDVAGINPAPAAGQP